MKNNIVYSRKDQITKAICKVDKSIELCKNIYEAYFKPTKYYGMKNVRGPLPVCSERKICKKTSFQLYKTYYLKSIVAGNMSDKWSNEYPIPAGMTRNMIHYPISYKFYSLEVFVKYLHQECQKHSMIYAVEDPIKTFPFYYQMKFMFEKTRMLSCRLKKSRKVECMPKTSSIRLGSYFPIEIKCKHLPEYGYLQQISKIPSSFCKYFLLYIFFQKNFFNF